MASQSDACRRACIDKTAAEVDALAARGVVAEGNAFSAVLLVKAAAFEDAEKTALKASLAALGYAPEDWELLRAQGSTGEPLAPDLLREAVCALDPATLIVLDAAAADALRDAYAEDLAAIEDLSAAMLDPGVVVRLCGMRVLNLQGFAEALGDSRQKQVMWARLKKLPPLGEPY